MAARVATASRNRAATPERKTSSEFASPHPLSLFTFPPSAGARSVRAERFPRSHAVRRGFRIVHLRDLTPWLRALVISLVFVIPGAIRAVVGLLAATTYACFGFSSVPFGFLADRRSPTRLLMLSAGGIAVSLGSLGLSPNLPWLALSLAGLGLSSGIYHPTALAAISRSVQAQGAAMGWHGMGGSLGIALGPAFVAATLASG